MKTVIRYGRRSLPLFCWPLRPARRISRSISARNRSASRRPRSSRWWERGSWRRTAADKVIMVDGRPWVASKDNPTKLLLQTARKLYGTSNEELMDNAKQFAYYPVAVLKSVDNFSNGTISMKFKTVAGDSDRCSGILFNVKPNGDWLAVRYNDTENNVALWEFHNGIRRNMKFSDRAKPFMLDRSAWHELKLTVDGAEPQGMARRHAGARVHARQRTGGGQERAAESGSVPGEQSGAAPAGGRQGRAVVEDGQHELLQGLRGEPGEVGPAIRKRSEKRLLTRAALK